MAGTVFSMGDKGIDKDFKPAPLGAWHRFWASRTLVHASPRQCPSLEDMKERLSSLDDETDFLRLAKMTAFNLSASEYASYEWGRVCRTCAWEPVLSYLLNNTSGENWVTFSSCSPKQKPADYRPSARADARLQRVVQASNLQLAHAQLGTVAFGAVSMEVMEFLRFNNVFYRCELLTQAAPTQVGLAWGLWQEEASEEGWDFAQALVTSGDVLGLPPIVKTSEVHTRTRRVRRAPTPTL